MVAAIVLPRRRALAFAAAGGLGLALAAWRVPAEGDARTIAVVAKRFTYDPDEIHLKVDEAIALELRSLDVVMGFNCPDLKLRTDILPGRVTRLELRPDKAGTFPFFCDVFCGSGHEDMNGAFIVEA
ncbi:MAG: cupredoxin domain-containing protein [Burkholderiaceae bacterium]|nr:cupredoxin domain-containing protein [Burkholderiaceae bacterium]